MEHSFSPNGQSNSFYVSFGATNNQLPLLVFPQELVINVPTSTLKPMAFLPHTGWSYHEQSMCGIYILA